MTPQQRTNLAESIDRGGHRQALINKGACIACLTFKAKPRENFCSWRCKDYYETCNALCVDIRWKTAFELSHLEFLARARMTETTQPPEVVML